jgi:hypothetical protein
MSKLLDKLNADRIESLKSGLFSAVTLGLAVNAATLGNIGLAARDSRLAALLPDANLMHWLIRSAIALLSGFLFGVTYRYIVRADDRNPHLRSGAVLAFGLVRGLAQIEIALACPELLVVAGVGAIESLLFFTAARLVLDWAIDRRWVC